MPARAPDARMRFAESLRSHREAGGLQQVELAVAVGVAEQTVRRWEHGKHDPPLSALCVLADHFGVTVDEIVGRH